MKRQLVFILACAQLVLNAAQHIDYLFPKLKSLSSYEGHDADRWIQMHDIQMYQAVRQEACYI